MFRGPPWWLSGKESICQCRRYRFHPWVGKIPWRRAWQPTPVFLPGEPYGQRSLVNYNLWGFKESVGHDWATELNWTELKYISRLPWWLSKESACQCRRWEFDPGVGKIPWRRKWQATPVFLTGESHGQRNLVGYSPWGRKRVRFD